MGTTIRNKLKSAGKSALVGGFTLFFAVGCVVKQQAQTPQPAQTSRARFLGYLENRSHLTIKNPHDPVKSEYNGEPAEIFFFSSPYYPGEQCSLVIKSSPPYCIGDTINTKAGGKYVIKENDSTFKAYSDWFETKNAIVPADSNINIIPIYID